MMRNVLFGRPVQAATLGLGLLIGGQDPAPAVTWEPVVVASSVVPTTDLFPAQILSMAFKNKGPASARHIGDTNGLLGVVAKSVKPGASVKVSIRVEALPRGKHAHPTHIER